LWLLKTLLFLLPMALLDLSGAWSNCAGVGRFVYCTFLPISTSFCVFSFIFF
jgi:hypothetical protein